MGMDHGHVGRGSPAAPPPKAHVCSSTATSQLLSTQRNVHVQGSSQSNQSVWWVTWRTPPSLWMPPFKGPAGQAEMGHFLPPASSLQGPLLPPGAQSMKVRGGEIWGSILLPRKAGKLTNYNQDQACPSTRQNLSSLLLPWT